MEPLRRIERTYRVRFDEADADGWLRPSGLLRFAQDMAWRHSEEAGFDRDWYLGHSMNWLVRNVTVSIMGSITYGDVLAVSTEVTGWRHVWARRHSKMRRIDPRADDRGDDLLATVDTDWVLLNDDGRPARVPAEIAEYFSAYGSFTRDRVVLPEPTSEITALSTRVRPLDVDPMRHMNNAAYLDMAQDGLARMPAAERLDAPDCYRIGYVRPALPGTAIDVSCWRLADARVACRISSRAGHELTRVLVSRSKPKA